MPTRTPPPDLELTVEPTVSAVDPDEWNALIQPDDPFTEHAFLLALEQSGSVGRETGWLPVHLLARRGDALVGAVPLYLKNHSYGEFIFDWGWAQAAQQAGIPYYPKLVAAVPFTPASGRRLLTGPGPLRADLARTLIGGITALANNTRAQSIHLLFITEEEHRLMEDIDGFIPRTTHQFHWHNDGYTDFDDWLSRFRSRRRKEVKRERRRAADSGATIRIASGESLTESERTALRQFYEDTIGRKWSNAYLTEDFFNRLQSDLGHTALVFLAEADGLPVAAALAFQRGNHLYGRYWGCAPGWEHLHFELCYHQPIALCIERGWTRFEAGAQGPHKIQRGLLPTRTYSAHHLVHPGLERAVRDAMVREDQMTEHEIAVLTAHGPFHREG
jgi:predicted N-acyltransferase